MVVWQIISIGLTGLQVASSLYTDSKTRQAAVAQEAASQAASEASRAESARARAQEALYKRMAASHDHTAQPRTFEIPSCAFNASPEFTAVFAASVHVGTVVAIQTGEQLKQIGLRLDEIREELGAQTTAKVQGWDSKGFGAFIYWFLENEISDHGGEASVGHHAFYIYNPTTSADVVFKQMIRERPLPASFGGFSSDLESVFHIMWENRRCLRQTMGRADADEVVFHLLIPAKRSFAVYERMAIDERVGRLIIKGHKEEGICYAWFNFVHVPPEVVLQDVGNLDTDHAEEESSERGFVQSGLAGLACGIGGAVLGTFFPPAVPYFTAGFLTSWASAMKYGPVDDVRRSMRTAPRRLGPSVNFVDNAYS